MLKPLPKETFQFTKVFSESTTQKEYFEATAVKMVRCITP